jgi:nitrogen-specific signal transduction histidine kinase
VPRLMVIQGIDEGRQFELAGPILGVGRDAANAVHLHDTEVSRRHAEFRLTLDGSGYRIHDRGSANGVFVNGTAVKDALLRPGDQLLIGQTVLVYTPSPGDRPPAGDLTDRIRMVARPDAELSSQIVSTIGDAEGGRILARPDDVQSPWLRTRLANLAILYEASRAVSHILDVDELLDRILELIFGSIEADRGCVMLLDPATGNLEPKAARWANKVPGTLATGDGSERAADTFLVSRTITDHVLRERQGILVSDAARDDRFAAGKSIIDVGIREAICVPMKGRHDALGVLYLDTISRPKSPARSKGSGADEAAYSVRGAYKPKFTEDHLALAIALAHQAALAIEGTRYYQAMVQAERLAAIGQTIASVSHHIKNILQGLRSGTDILRMGIEGRDDELLGQGWKILDKNQGKIFHLVMDMLSYSKDREPAAEPTDLNELVAEVVELMKPRAVELNVALTTKLAVDLPITSVDREAIHRALLNLLSNALDAVEGRPDAEVRIETMVESDGWILIAVGDNGVGIPGDKLADLFKPFFSTKGARGTGLGLAVSRKTLREHGGDILVKSHPGEGSTFTLRLPVKGVHAADAAPPTEPPPD